jgi:hypothetical protein
VSADERTLEGDRSSVEPDAHVRKPIARVRPGLKSWPPLHHRGALPVEIPSSETNRNERLRNHEERTALDRLSHDAHQIVITGES